MRRVPVRKLLTVLFLSLTMIATAYPASAGGWGYHGRGHGGYYHGYGGHHYKHFKRHGGHGYYRHRHYGHHRHRGRHDDFLLGAGIIGGAIIVGSVLSRPQPPPPVVYYSPPPPPTCVQDQVYRYLPDGSLQWGTRTRCY